MKEHIIKPVAGWGPLAVLLAILVASPILITVGAQTAGPKRVALIIAGVLTSLAFLIGLCGFLAIAPNSARVLLLFGEYSWLRCRVRLLLGEPILLEAEDQSPHTQLRDWVDDDPGGQGWPGQHRMKKSQPAGRPSKGE